jgi:two-component system response regulator (stage 0 sporulation protein A)
LVEDDREMRAAFSFCIEKNPLFQMVGETGKQAEAIEILKGGCVDAVILDLELEEGDGIHFLGEMKSLPVERPLVVVITNNRSAAVLELIRAQGADFICQKCNESYSPVNVLSIVEQTYPFHKNKRNSRMEVIQYEISKEEEYRRNRIEDYLTALGLKAHSRSCNYLIEAIYKVAFEMGDSRYTIKEVYEAVAKKYDTKGVNVEKVIRDGIEKVWTKSEHEVLVSIYPYEISGESGSPTNSEFIRNVAGKFKRV